MGEHKHSQLSPPSLSASVGSLSFSSTFLRYQTRDALLRVVRWEFTICAFFKFFRPLSREKMGRALCPEAVRPRWPRLQPSNEKGGLRGSEHIFFSLFQAQPCTKQSPRPGKPLQVAASSCLSPTSPNPKKLKSTGRVE